MICCDTCEDWFHGKCVGISKAQGMFNILVGVFINHRFKNFMLCYYEIKILIVLFVVIVWVLVWFLVYYV